MFLDSKNYRSQVESLIAQSESLKIAVAFWGKDAESLLQSTSKKFKVICNLTSGGTNPDVIRKLREWAPRVEVLHHNDLHAKVFIGQNSAIIGSANMSTNGLNIESDEFDGWQEAGYRTTQADDVQATGEWFDKQWAESVPIDDAMIDAAEVAWKNRRATRIRRPGSSSRLLDVKPEAFKDKNIFVMFYKGEVSPRAIEVDAELKKSNPTSFSKWTYVEDADGVENGHELISVCLDDPATFKVDGAYMVKHIESFKNGRRKSSLHYLDKVNKFKSGYTFKKEDATTLQKLLLKLPPEQLEALHAQEHWYIPFNEMLLMLRTK